MATMYRQGDVLLLKIDALPDGATIEAKEERIVLAYGEVTGHAHALATNYACAYSKGSERFVDAVEGCTLTHEEHAPIALSPGVYKVIRQREYTPAEIRTVAD